MCTVLYLRTVCYKQRRRMYAMCVPIFKIILASFVYDVILEGDVYWLKICGFQK